jgi:hypothetical protein
MKLVLTETYLSHKKRINIPLYTFLIFIFISQSLTAQKYNIQFVNTPISEALLQVSEQFQIKVAFDAGKLSQNTVSGEFIGYTPEELIQNILTNTNFTFQNKHGRFLIIENLPLPQNIIPETFITGSVTDSETGEQLPFATINQPDRRTDFSASQSGTFFLKTTANQPLHINISYIGYGTIDTVLTKPEGHININFKLARKVQSFNAVDVRETPNEMVEFRKDVDFATTLNPSKLVDLPMFAETDVFKALQLLPGISYSENSSELSIRGGSGYQNLILYDGQTLYNLSHYFGVFSTINPNVVKDVQIFKGGYDSRYGERVSGIIDITGKSGNQLRPTIYGDINFVSGNLAAEIPISNKLTLVAAGRRSYSDIYATEFANNLLERSSSSINEDPNSTIIQTTPKFYYYDYNTKLTYHFSESENISLNAFGGKDYYNNTYDVSKPSFSSDNNDINRLNNYGLSLSWQKQWNGAFFTNYQIGTSGYFNNYNNTTIIESSTDSTTTNRPYLPDSINTFETNTKNTLSDKSLSLRNTWYINNSNTLNFGFLTRQNSLLYYKDADQVYIYDNNRQKAWIYSLYAMDQYDMTNKFSIKPGLRVNYYAGNKGLYFEPRLSLNYRFTNKISARVATGHFCQYLSQAIAQQESGYSKSFWVLADDSIHPVLKSDHFIIGSTFEFGHFLFDIEAYYKNFLGIQEYVYVSHYLKNSDFPKYFDNNSPTQTKPTGPGTNPRNPNKLKSAEVFQKLQASHFYKGKGYAQGIDFFIRYKYKAYTSWISYSISKSINKFADINNNAELPAPTDQTHQISWTQMLTYKKWNFGTITLFSTGKPYIDSTVNTNNLPTTRYYNRLPNYFRADFTINYNFRLAKARLKAGATIINIFNTNNYFDISTRRIDFQTSTFDETNLIRAQKLSLNLFLHFVI